MSATMRCVFMCVVLAIVGNVSSSVIRTRRDLAQDVIDIYGPSPNISSEEDDVPDYIPPPPPPPPHHGHQPAKLRDPGESIPQSDQHTAFGPPQKKWKPDSEPPAPDFSTFSQNVHPRPTEVTGPARRETIKLTDEEEKIFIQREITRIFGTPSPAPLQELNANVNSTADNKTGTFGTDDRFLSSPLVKGQFYNNLEENSNTDINPSEKAFVPLSVPSESVKDRSLLVPKQSETLPVDSNPVAPRGIEFRNTILKPPEHTNHIVTPTSHANGSSKNVVSSSLLLVLSYFCSRLVSIKT